MAESAVESGLYYAASGLPVRLGDHVRMKRFLRKSINGVVCYIPGLSPIHAELEYDDVKQWAIRSDDGAVYPILFDPPRFQPPKDIEFIGRGQGGQLLSHEILE